MINLTSVIFVLQRYTEERNEFAKKLREPVDGCGNCGFWRDTLEACARCGQVVLFQFCFCFLLGSPHLDFSCILRRIIALAIFC